MTYRIYISENLRMATENIAKGVGGNYIKKSYKDLISHKKTKKVNAKDIISDVSERAGLKVVSVLK